MPWPQVSDLATMLQRTFDAAEMAAATRVLRSVKAKIRAEARHPIDLASDTLVLEGSYGNVLWLPAPPVIAVTSVQLATDAEPLAAAGYTWTRRGALIRGAGDQVLNGPPSGYWGGPGVGVTVVYQHGFADVPEELAEMCLDVALRRFENPTGLVSESIGTYSATSSDETAGVELTEDEKRICRRYRSRSV